MTPIQALQNIFNAARQARLTGDEHEIIVQSAKLLNDALKQKEEAPKDK